MTEHKADPDAGWAKKASERWPIPRGCWRRVWRHTMSWDGDRDEGQKARLGKTIDIGGEKVSMMWPGELGDPPGYDLQLNYYGEIGGVHYDFWRFQHAITQEQYDAMERPGGDEAKYTRYYTVVDVEGLFKAAYRSNSSAESRIAERHDPTVTEWLADVSGTVKEYPVFEIKADLINDIREALLQLKILRQYCTVSFATYISNASLGGFSTSLAAYDAGKAHCDSEIDVSAGPGYGDVGYEGFVPYVGATGDYATFGDIDGHDYTMGKLWSEVTITKGTNECFPAREVGTLVLDIRVKAGDSAFTVTEACTIGVGTFTYKPTSTTEWKRAYVGEVPGDCDWVYDGAGDDPSDWNLQCTFRIVPVDPWPPDAHFDFVGNGISGKQWNRVTWVSVTTGANQALAWELDFDGFDKSVFEQDPMNCIEV